MAVPDQIISVRPARPDDAGPLAGLLNVIIRQGGTTAIEDILDEAAFAAWFLEGPDHVSCLVATGPSGEHLGFQVLERADKLPSGWVDIASFARQETPVRGVGTALFASTVPLARAAGFKAINATIRADNTPGLAFYEKMGFVTYGLDRAVPLKDGTPVDRIHKRFLLAGQPGD